MKRTTGTMMFATKCTAQFNSSDFTTGILSSLLVFDLAMSLALLRIGEVGTEVGELLQEVFVAARDELHVGHV